MRGERGHPAGRDDLLGAPSGNYQRLPTAGEQSAPAFKFTFVDLEARVLERPAAAA